MTQFISRGLRKAPVKKIRSRCAPMAATNIRAAQWCICRMRSPPRTSKLMRRVESNACVMRTPRIGTYRPSYTTSPIPGWKKNVSHTPVTTSTIKL